MRILSAHFIPFTWWDPLVGPASARALPCRHHEHSLGRPPILSDRYKVNFLIKSRRLPLQTTHEHHVVVPALIMHALNEVSMFDVQWPMLNAQLPVKHRTTIKRHWLQTRELVCVRSNLAIWALRI